MLKKSKKETKSKIEKEAEVAKQRSQDWIPVSHIQDGILFDKDGTVHVFVRITPINLSLFSDEEKESRIDWLTTSLSTMDAKDFSIYAIGRPVDLSGYINGLKYKLENEKNHKKKMALRHSIAEAQNIEKSETINERQFYLQLTEKYEKNIESVIKKKLSSVIHSFSQAGINCTACNDKEITDILRLFVRPSAIKEPDIEDYIVPYFGNK